MKPKPFASLNHFTIPVAISLTLFNRCVVKRDGGPPHTHVFNRRECSEQLAFPTGGVTPNRRFRYLAFDTWIAGIVPGMFHTPSYPVHCTAARDTRPLG